MTISSMTGFARSEGQTDTSAWTWEVKSVNAKGLDLRFRIPPGFERLEPAIRNRAQERFRRGSVTLSLGVSWNNGNAGFRINREVLEELLAALPEIRKQFPDAGPPSLDGLLGLRGVIEQTAIELSDKDKEAMDAAILASLDAALDALAAMRGEEGGRLESSLVGMLDDIARLADEAETMAAVQPDAIHKRLKAQVQELLDASPALPGDRLAQEVALLASKADLREELDRLKAHQEAARDLVAGSGAVGRKLDFLCQEFNREANTLCSKSQDVDLTRIGLDLKAAIEQFREQVQNIE